MNPSEMSSIMQAYSAVHSTEVKEELDSNRDQISEMRLTQFTDKDLHEVAEEILEGIFTEGSSVAHAQDIIESIFVTSDIPGRQQKKIPALKIGGQWKAKKEHIDKMFDELLQEKLNALQSP